MDEPKITLDQSTFKALAAGTRVKILKTLEKRRHTQSELSGVLDMSVPTVKEHLAALEKAGLVKKHEEGRKWKYYSLTEKSKCVLDPERKRLWIVLGFFILSIAGTIITAKNYLAGSLGTFNAAPKMLAQEFAVPEAAEKVVATGARAAADTAQEIVATGAKIAVEEAEDQAVMLATDAVSTAAKEVPHNITMVAPEAISTQPPYILIGFAVLTIILLILGIYFFRRSKLGKSLNKK